MTNRGSTAVRRRGLTVALVTAACVLGVMLAQAVLSPLIFVLAVGPVAGQSPSDILPSVQSVVLDSAFAAGVFLCLWLVAPMRADIRMSQAIIRSVLAAVAGALVAGVVQLLIGGWFAFILPPGATTGFESSPWVRAAGEALSTFGQMLVSTLPLVVLAGVLVWIWLGRHPRADTAAGFLDHV